MTNFILEAAFVGFVVSLLSSLIIVVTKKYHSRITSDIFEGIQKFHSAPTPRIGGLPLALGLIAACFLLENDSARILAWTIIAAIPAFVFGLNEDIFKNSGIRTRLIATFVSGVIFPSEQVILWNVSKWAGSIYFLQTRYSLSHLQHFQLAPQQIL